MEINVDAISLSSNNFKESTIPKEKNELALFVAK
jgi:hypothetical protein